jgi:hypothetical protein
MVFEYLDAIFLYSKEAIDEIKPIIIEKVS